MFLALRLAPPSNSVDPASPEALRRSQPARLTLGSRFSAPKPTDSLPFLPRTITQVPGEEICSVNASILVTGGWRRNVLTSLDCSCRSWPGSAPGAGPISRISAVTADAASAVATALYCSPAAIA